MRLFLPQLKCLLGSSQRVFVQMVDVHSFSEISDAHKYAQSFVRKADRMGGVVGFPNLEPVQGREEVLQVLAKKITNTSSSNQVANEVASGLAN